MASEEQHIHYKGKVLTVLSGCHSIALERKGGREIEKETGIFLKELAQPLIQLTEDGYQVVFASQDGKTAQVDLTAGSPLWFLGSWADKYLETEFFKSLEQAFQSPSAFSSFTDSELQSFTGIFISGGHSPTGDLGTDKHLGRILNHFHKASKPTGVICHGPIALLSTQTLDDDSPGGLNKFAYEDYKMTCYTSKEELSAELLWGARLHKKVEDALNEAGARVDVASVPHATKVLRDKELISADGPASAWKFGKMFVEMLDEYREGAAKKQAPEHN